jgi:hypothetical protein
MEPQILQRCVHNFLYFPTKKKLITHCCSFFLFFHEDDLNRVKLLINAGRYEIPHAIDPPSLALLRRFLSHAPERRNVTGPQLRASHSYFRGVNWRDLVNRVYITPYAPPRPALNHDIQWDVDHSNQYLDRDVRTRDRYGGWFNHFHYVRTPWIVTKDGQPPFRLPPSDTADN